jgi:hypothetical protein
MDYEEIIEAVRQAGVGPSRDTAKRAAQATPQTLAGRLPDILRSVARSTRSAQSRFGQRGCWRRRTASLWRRSGLSAVFHAGTAADEILGTHRWSP